MVPTNPGPKPTHTLRATAQESIVTGMHTSLRSYFTVLATAITLCGSPVIYGQTEQPSPKRCAPSYTQTDAFKEMTGLKDYPKIHVDSAKIEGATKVAQNDQDELIASLEHREFVRNKDWPGAIVRPVEELWRDEGFFKVQVTSEEKILSSDLTLQHLSLVFNVQEGDQYRLRSVHFRNVDAKAPLAFSSEQLRKLVPMEDGELFDVRKVRLGLENLTNQFSNAGYIDFVAIPETIFQNSSDLISLEMQFEPATQYRIASLQFLGNYSQAQDSLKSCLKVGETFSPITINNFFQRNKAILPALVSLDDLQITRNQKDSTVNLVFDFRDCPR
ncbi:MAG TPA: POTRA domain-containing protein [Candidatus Acidoferrales bacterium]|nr:POTRA domain-containing protein [Candidatus Acidoferrales bacterium]